MLTGKTLSNIQGCRKHKPQAVFLGPVLGVCHPFTCNCWWLSPRRTTPCRSEERNRKHSSSALSHPLLLLGGPKIEESWVSFVPIPLAHISHITAKPHAKAKQEMSKEIVCCLATSPCDGVLYSPVENHSRSYVATLQTAHRNNPRHLAFSHVADFTPPKIYTQ